jgi:hypothetical protein
VQQPAIAGPNKVQRALGADAGVQHHTVDHGDGRKRPCSGSGAARVPGQEPAAGACQQEAAGPVYNALVGWPLMQLQALACGQGKRSLVKPELTIFRSSAPGTFGLGTTASSLSAFANIHRMLPVKASCSMARQAPFRRLPLKQQTPFRLPLRHHAACNASNALRLPFRRCRHACATPPCPPCRSPHPPR